jgi:hypothetical protein|tara:strand:+ start:925 stop:1182 length:258 start_codon:yes stop_codon:yes gene_type:complete
MTDIIKQVDEDGEEYEFDLDVCTEAAMEALDGLFEKENVVEHFDFTAAIYSVFISSITILAQSGWTTEELMSEVTLHSKQDETMH